MSDNKEVTTSGFPHENKTPLANCMYLSILNCWLKLHADKCTCGFILHYIYIVYSLKSDEQQQNTANWTKHV